MRAQRPDSRRIASLHVSSVGLGCNNFGRRLDAAATAAVVHAALDAGITFFDTADSYGDGRSEEFLGRALAAHRRETVVATKFGWKMPDGTKAGAHPSRVRAAAEASLRRLGTDYIDLYQLHTPDPDVPIADTLGALNELVHSGKVREIGCSNFSVPQLRDAERATVPGAARFVSVQNEYSLLHREPEEGVLQECERQEMAFLPWYPLASGLLTGKYRKGEPPPPGTRLSEGGRYAPLLSDRTVETAEELATWAEARGHTVLELAFVWLLAHPVVASVIAGATKPEQVRANAAAGVWRLTDAELEEVDGIVASVAWRSV